MTISLCLVSLLVIIRPSLGLLLPSPLPSPSLLPIPLISGTTTIEGTGSTCSSRLRCNNSNNKSKSSRILLLTATTTTTTLYNSNQDKEEEKEKSASLSSIFSEDDISNFCKGTNAFWKGLVIEPVRNYVEIRPATGTTSTTGDIFSKLIAPPEVPGIPRPVWFTILGSVPTGLGWYGYYKFSVEEELFQHELQTNKDGNVSGCGGYGTLFPFVYGIIIGFPMSLLHIPGGEFIIQSAAIWILAGQVNLYRRVNELCFEDENIKNEILGGGGYKEDGDNDENDNDEPLQPPLHAWWALLPPPLDVVVGLRQVHFLSEYWRVVRGEPYNKDVIAEELFPFISSKRFTLKEFVRKPSNWFWFTKKWKDLDNIDFLKD